MRQLNLATQAQDYTLTRQKLATDALASVLESKPVDRGVVGAAPLAVAANEASIAVAIPGPFIANGDSVYTTLGRDVNKGTYATKDTDPLPSVAPFLNSLVQLRDNATGNPIEVGGKELVGFLTIDTANANATSIVFYTDNKDGTFTAENMPAAYDVAYKFRKRFSLQDVDLSEDRLFVVGATDVTERADLDQLLKDLYGTGYAFNGTGDAVLGTSLREQIADHLADTVDAHDATAIGFSGTTSGLTATNVAQALEEAFTGSTSRLEQYTDELRSDGVLEANPLAPSALLTGTGTATLGAGAFTVYANGIRSTYVGNPNQWDASVVADGTYIVKATVVAALGATNTTLAVDQINPAPGEVKLGTVTVAGGLIAAIDNTSRDITFAVDKTVLTHLNATTGAHNAAAIALVDAANKFAATDVEAGLLELRTAIDSLAGGGGGTSLASLQTEIDNIEATLGSAIDGTYDFATNMAASNYLKTITDVIGGLVALDTQVKANADAIGAEVTARQNAITGVTDAINNEITARQNADTALQDAIDAETARATGAEDALNTAINNEITARQSADTAITNALNAHINLATDAHDASAISVVATGDLTSINVQAALEEHQADIDALTAALAAMDSATTADIDIVAFNTGVSKAAKGITYSSNKYLASLAADGSGDDHTEALGKLDNQLYTLAAMLGIPVEGEKLVLSAGGAGTLAWANGMVAGCKPMLVINGSTETPGAIVDGDDYEITADVNGKLRNLQLSPATAAAFNSATDTAVIWYRGAIA